MKDFYKRAVVAVGSVMAGASVFAEGSDSFDPSEFISSATTTVTSVVTAIGTLLAAALGLYLAFVGYKKAKEALSKA